MRTKRAWLGAVLVILMLAGEVFVVPAAGSTDDHATEEAPVAASDRQVFSSTTLSANATDLELVAGAPLEAVVLYEDQTASAVGPLHEPSPSLSPLPVTGAVDITVADLDGDGIAHVVAVSAGGDILQPQLGVPALALPSLGGPIRSMDALEADDDMAHELAFVSGSGSSVAIVAQTEGALLVQRDIELPHAANGLTTGDLIPGERDEIVITGDGAVTVVQLQTGSPIVTTYPIDGAIQSEIGRVDGDPYPDLAVARDDGFSLLRGDGVGGFAPAADQTTSGVPIDIDIAAGVEGQAGEVIVTTATQLWSFLAEDDGSFAAAVEVPGTGENVMLETNELNGDADDDLVVIEDGGDSLTVLRTNRPPALGPLGDVDAVQDEAISISLEAEDPDGDAVSFDVAGLPTDSSFDPETGSFTWTPNAIGTTSLTVDASDWSHHTVDVMNIKVAAKPHVGKITFALWKTGPVTKIADLRAQVDGLADRVSFAWALPDGNTWHGIDEDKEGSDGWTAKWNTEGKNGTFRLRARAIYNGDQATDTTSVLVDNRTPRVRLHTPKAFSPNNDGTHDSLLVKARASERAHFTLALVRDDRTLRRWSWQSARRKILVRWDGRAGGRKLSDHGYRFQVRVRDRVGRTDADGRSTRIDTKAPSFRWRAVPRGLVTETGRLRVRYRAVDRAGPVRVRLKLLHVGLPAAGHTSKIKGRGGWSIRPRYRDGSAFVPGSYALRTKVTDRVGNTRRMDPKRWSYAPPRRGRAYMRLEHTGRQLALTFDDCNYGSAWQSILNTLKTHDVEATFFCGGSLVRRYPSMARRTVHEGHDGASHGYNHRLMTTLSSTAARSQIAGDRDAWKDVTGRPAVPFFRPPYGGFDGSTLSIAGSLGFSRVMIWDVDTLDWKTQSSFSTSSHVQSRARSGSVVLMHVLPSTAAALPAILRGLKHRGLRPVTLTKLFRTAGHH